MEATPQNTNFFKLLVKYLYEKPSCIFCIIALYGAFIMYNDNQDFIREQQVVLREMSTTQVEIQKSLVELNIRVQAIENHSTKNNQ